MSDCVHREKETLSRDLVRMYTCNPDLDHVALKLHPRHQQLDQLRNSSTKLSWYLKFVWTSSSRYRAEHAMDPVTSIAVLGGVVSVHKACDCDGVQARANQ